MKHATLFVIFIILLMGCASRQMSYSPSATYSENDYRDINDEDILKAFKAQPQIVLPTKIAWYNLSKDTLYKNLFVTDNKVDLNYTIPKSLIEGFSPYRGNYYEPYYFYSRPTSVNIKALRLLAARARCDLLILVSTRFGERRKLNKLAWFNLFIFPTFFTKYLDVTYSYDAELYIFDVRNGYMYKHATIEPDEIKRTINSKDIETTAKEVNKIFIAQASEYLKSEVNLALKEEK